MSRKVERTIEIAAPVETVWKALTDPQEITRWFCFESSVEPGVGGTIRYSWGAPWDGVSRIEVWEPNRRLRMVSYTPEGKETWLSEGSGTAPGEGHPLALEYLLEGRGGGTVLRLVHSGFGAGGGWDDEYDGVRRGWAFELGSLRQYLEKHAGRDRAHAWARCAVGLPMDEAWRRLTGPEGIVRGGVPRGLSAGQEWAFTLATGERIEGIVLSHDPPAQLATTARNMGDGLWRIELFTSAGTRQASLWLSVWARPASELKPVEARWAALLARLLPGDAPPARS